MTLPLWAIRHLTQPYGVRLPKGPTPYYRVTPANGPRRVTIADSWMKDGKPVAGNLANHDYEYWLGNLSSDYATCRWCNAIKKGDKERAEHFDSTKFDCTLNIRAAAKLLQKDRKCVVCDTKTIKKTWGFPLCSPTCIAVWKFETFPHDAFRAAKLLVDPEFYRRSWGR